MLTHLHFCFPQSPPKGVTIPYRPKPSGSPVIFAGGQVYALLWKHSLVYIYNIVYVNCTDCVHNFGCHILEHTVSGQFIRDSDCQELIEFNTASSMMWKCCSIIKEMCTNFVVVILNFTIFRQVASQIENRYLNAKPSTLRAGGFFAVSFF